MIHWWVESLQRWSIGLSQLQSPKVFSINPHLVLYVILSFVKDLPIFWWPAKLKASNLLSLPIIYILDSVLVTVIAKEEFKDSLDIVFCQVSGCPPPSSYTNLDMSLCHCLSGASVVKTGIFEEMWASLTVFCSVPFPIVLWRISVKSKLVCVLFNSISRSWNQPESKRRRDNPRVFFFWLTIKHLKHLKCDNFIQEKESKHLFLFKNHSRCFWRMRIKGAYIETSSGGRYKREVTKKGETCRWSMI